MTRGREPAFGLGAALPVARARGRVMQFRHSPDNTADFLISGSRCIALIAIRKARRLHAPLAEIARDYSGTVNELSTIPTGGPVSREIWLYSRFGILRFFRVGTDGLVELDFHGQPIETTPPEPVLPAGSPSGEVSGHQVPAPVQGGPEGSI
jgi:hypothetical protein